MQALHNQDRRRHWERVYELSNPLTVGWYQAVPQVSLDLIRQLELPPNSAILDVGGGASKLVDHLLACEYVDLTVLDISTSALSAAKERVGDDDRVEWIGADLLSWVPRRRYDLWHDRAVLHFVVDPAARRRYLQVLNLALSDSGAVIIGTFAADGPDTCSGLPVTRYAPQELIDLLRPGFTPIATQRELHTTPVGTIQPFSWVAATRCKCDLSASSLPPC
jgi:SAM-dependent methyltransferase